MSLFSSIQAEKYRGYEQGWINPCSRAENVLPREASNSRWSGWNFIFHGFGWPLPTVNSEFNSSNYASGCTFTPGNRVSDKSRYPGTRCPCPAFPIELSARSTSFYSISPPFLRVGWSRCECWKPGKFPSSILLLFFFFFFIVTLGNSWEAKFFSNSNL